MGIRRAHGNGADALVRVETLPVDELPAGVPGIEHAEARDERTDGGRWAPGASTAQSKGGKTRRGKVTLALKLGLTAVDNDPKFAPYRRAAIAFRRAHTSSLASTVGGGVCGTGPSSIVASAALALAASRFLYDTANGDPAILAQAARLADSSRQGILTAHELCAREAQARKRAAPSPLDAIRARIAEETAK